MGAATGVPSTPLASSMPAAETIAPSPGKADEAARADHQHPRLTSATVGTLNASGQQTVMFTRIFDKEPSVTVLAVENNTQSPPDFKVTKFLAPDGSDWTNGAQYGGCVIYGTRARPLPVVTAVLTGLVTALSGYVTTEPAANVKFSIIAVQASS